LSESTDEQSPLEPVVEIFDRHGVEYIVIGGMAAVLAGALRPTYDIDLCYRRTPDNIRRLAAALGELRPKLRGAPPDLPFTPDERTLTNGSNFTFDTVHGSLDLLGWVEPLGDFEGVLRCAHAVPFGDRRLQSLTVEGLIRVKEHLRREKDVSALAELRAIQREQARSTPE
jgi:hypothetical protein